MEPTEPTDSFVMKANSRPSGTKFIAHHSGQGVIAVHPDEQPVFILYDGTTQVLEAKHVEPYEMRFAQIAGGNNKPRLTGWSFNYDLQRWEAPQADPPLKPQRKPPKVMAVT